MTLQLAPEEPEAGPWRVEPLSTIVNTATDQGSSGRPAVLLPYEPGTEIVVAPPPPSRVLRERGGTISGESVRDRVPENVWVRISDMRGGGR